MMRTDIVAEGLVRRLAVLGAAGFGVGLGLTLGGRNAGLRSFGQQTAAWGAIDLAIAAVGHTHRAAPISQSRLRTILLINTALDVGYVAAGAHVAAHRSSFGGRLSPEAARGHGLAVVVQGALLFALDLVHVSMLTRDVRPRYRGLRRGESPLPRR